MTEIKLLLYVKIAFQESLILVQFKGLFFFLIK